MNPPAHDPSDTPAHAPPHDHLDAALARALPRPELPVGFHARLQAARLREQTDTLAQRRRELQALHEHERALLESGHGRLRRHTLAMVAGVSFALGAVATAALPWMQAQAGVEASVLMPLLAAALGAAVGLGAWLLRAGRLRWDSGWF